MSGGAGSGKSSGAVTDFLGAASEGISDIGNIKVSKGTFATHTEDAGAAPSARHARPFRGEIVEDLEKQYPGLKERLCDERGELRRFVNLYLNDEDIRFAKGKETAVKDGDEISIIPAIAGGRR